MDICNCNKGFCSTTISHNNLFADSNSHHFGSVMAFIAIKVHRTTFGNVVNDEYGKH